ncbi:hypothetical protein [Nocardia cyriacigeorgica]|uniref:hypothetical protein n=1 Tax=Nocardia cyriacigeorgica TaxID=135487 RepID=UPI0018947FE9|nr:hypothetical protein [Nocardia cyriacigeorgica]MBF6412786.1 hypothetical protein [Nocardia cyriacigeorgica]
MANIATVFVRMNLRDPADELAGQEVLDDVLGSGGTYHVPTWSRRTDDVLDVQFGAKWGAGGLAEKLWARWSTRVTSVWVRWYDDGGDFDDIEHRPVSRSMRERKEYTYRGGTWIRRCRYRYNGIRVSWRTELPGAATLGGFLWRRDGTALVAGAAGDYLAGNDRCDLSDDPEIHTPTTPARSLFSFEGGLDHELYRWWREAGLPGSLSDDDLSLILSCGDRLELLWDGRPVMVMLAENSPGTWRVYSLDDWDNCADPDFLQSTS